MTDMHFTFSIEFPYDEHAQLITCSLHPTGTVQFIDHSNDVSGLTKHRFPRGHRSPYGQARTLEVKRECLARWLLDQYEHNRYRPCSSMLAPTQPIYHLL